MQRKPLLFTLFLTLFGLLLVACAPEQARSVSPDTLSKNADGYTDISVQQLNEMLSNKDFTLVNVHVPFDGDLPQTDVSIPFDQIANQLNNLPDKDAPIVLYCRSGNMSTTAAKVLTALGYTNVYELDGGFNAWKTAKLPMAGE